MPVALPYEARGLATHVLAALPERLPHSEAAAIQARTLAGTVAAEAVDTLIAAAWLHDLGYADWLRKTGFHPLDGASFLRREGWPDPVCALVAHHSGSRFLARVQGLEDQLADYQFIEDPYPTRSLSPTTPQAPPE